MSLTTCRRRSDVDGPLVFVGYGISSPRLKFDELAGVNLRGRIAVVIDTNPHAEDFSVRLSIAWISTTRRRFSQRHEMSRKPALSD